MMKKFVFLQLLLLCCLGNIYSQTKDSLIITTLQFNVNTDSLIHNDNYNIFKENVVPYILFNSGNLKNITITGSSSPEGSYKINKYLADKRAAATVKLLPDNLSKYISTYSIEEDYYGLYNLIYNSDEPYKDDVLFILSNSKNKKIDLQKLQNGIVWEDMKYKYFPQLRSAKILADFSFECKKQETDTIYITKTDTIYISKIDTQYVDIRKTWKKYPLLSVKTNALIDLIPYSPFGVSFTPNIQFELYTWLSGISLEFAYTFPWWHNDNNYKYYQLINYCFGVRKYFNNQYSKWYIGIYGNKGKFDFCINEDKGWQGEEYGLGLTIGYVFQKGRFKLEPYLRAGWIGGKYDSYHAGDPFNGKYYYDWNKSFYDFKQRNNNIKYFGPTMIGFNISYDLITIRKK